MRRRQGYTARELAQETFVMRINVLTIAAAISVLAGCAHHGMNHGAMSHEP